MDFPKTPDPEKWISDVALTKFDLMDNKIGGEDIEVFCKKVGLPKPKYRFENGKRIKIQDETKEERLIR